MSDDELELSLVICTRNRAAFLPAALKSLAGLKSSRAWEIVIVDNGSSDDTARLLDEASDRFGSRLRRVFEAKAGLGRARNSGWRAARGEIIAFTDDDCYPAEQLVDDILACFADPELGFLGGRILLFDPTDLPVTIQLHDERVDIEPKDVLFPGLIQGANFAVRRKVLEAIGGFDDHMGAGTPFACEDIDAVSRASAAGWKGAYDPRPYVYHHHRRKTQAARRKLVRSYDTGRGAYFAKAIMNPAVSRVYAARWLRVLISQNPIRTLRELYGGLHFFLGSARRWQQDFLRTDRD